MLLVHLQRVSHNTGTDHQEWHRLIPSVSGTYQHPFTRSNLLMYLEFPIQSLQVSICGIGKESVFVTTFTLLKYKICNFHLAWNQNTWRAPLAIAKLNYAIVQHVPELPLTSQDSFCMNIASWVGSVPPAVSDKYVKGLLWTRTDGSSTQNVMEEPDDTETECPMEVAVKGPKLRNSEVLASLEQKLAHISDKELAAVKAGMPLAQVHMPSLWHS